MSEIEKLRMKVDFLRELIHERQLYTDHLRGLVLEFEKKIAELRDRS